MSGGSQGELRPAGRMGIHGETGSHTVSPHLEATHCDDGGKLESSRWS